VRLDLADGRERRRDHALARCLVGSRAYARVAWHTRLVNGLSEALARVRAWGEAHDWCGYDPYDALNSRFASLLTAGSPLGKRVLTQVVKRAPLNLRPILRVPVGRNAMAIALVASGYIRLAATGDEAAAASARRWLDWLVENHSGGDALAWGYHFPVQTRFFGYDRDAPNAIATSFAAHALLDALELLGEERYAAPLRAVAGFVSDDLLVNSSRPYFRYLCGEAELVHNANLLVAGFLARASRALDDEGIAAPVLGTVATTLDAQRGDGAWPYAEAPERDWVDNFHTGYVLQSLSYCVDVPGVRTALERGYAYWMGHLFLQDGSPKYFPDRAYPLDAQAYSQAVETHVAMIGVVGGAHDHARRAAEVLVATMVAPDGGVYFQRHRRWTNRIAFVRWSAAPTFRALAGLLLADRRR
jgi:polysaccharide biosynthesis protein VpsJ